jgi:beta-N-acetylhexosaminidase
VQRIVNEPSREETGSLLIAGFEGTRPSCEIKMLIREHSLGGVILYGKNCVDPDQVRELINSLQEEARESGAAYPLLIAMDQEQGRVVRLREGITLFPAMGAIARAGNPDIVKRVALAVSRELLALGVNWNLAPVADVLSVPCAAAAVGDRSFGAYPAAVGTMVAAYVRGAEEAGMISCLKHFPGHGGTGSDSHLTSPRIDRSRSDLETVDFLPFRQGIAAGASTVMTAHITFPALDASLPATFSPAVIEGTLRRDLGFGGLVVSDDLEMAGAAENFSLAEGALFALNAGVDALLVSGMILPERDLPGLIENLTLAIGEGRLRSERVEAARGKIRSLKKRYLEGKWRRSPRKARSLLRCRRHLDLLREVEAALPKVGNDAE